jgi:glutamyl-tRNA reductase
MIPITVITWQLGVLSSEDFEKVICLPQMKDKVLASLKEKYEGVYYLATCQRVIIVFPVVFPKSSRAYLEYTKLIGLNRQEVKQPETFAGREALNYLTETINGLNSVVLGEHHIQGQFKGAFIECSPYMNKSLSFLIQQILQVGKKVRETSLLKKGQISTIQFVERMIKEKLQRASSIGVIGTGKMGKGVVKFFKEKYPNLTVYTSTEEREGELLEGLRIYPLTNLKKHEVLISATSNAGFIDLGFIKEYQLVFPLVIVDLGMPRNCHSSILKLPNLELYDMEGLIHKSKKENKDEKLQSVYSLIELKLDQLEKKYLKHQKSKNIISLRNELLTEAKTRKEEFLSGQIDEKTFDQFIKKMTHISQKHLEKILL